MHWEQVDDLPNGGVPAWSTADQRMRASGRASKVKFPSSRHANLSYRPPRVTIGGPILPRIAWAE